jgi:hypothetical protein
MQANMDEGAVLAECATFLLAETTSKQKAGKLVEPPLAKGGSFIAVLGQLEKELARRWPAIRCFHIIRSVEHSWEPPPVWVWRHWQVTRFERSKMAMI